MSLETDLPDSPATEKPAESTGSIKKLADAELDAVIADILIMKGEKDSLDKRMELKHVGESWIVDTDKLKKSGLFDTYKKARAGYDKLDLKLRAK